MISAPKADWGTRFSKPFNPVAADLHPDTTTYGTEVNGPRN